MFLPPFMFYDVDHVKSTHLCGAPAVEYIYALWKMKNYGNFGLETIQTNYWLNCGYQFNGFANKFVEMYTNFMKIVGVNIKSVK